LITPFVLKRKHTRSHPLDSKNLNNVIEQTPKINESNGDLPTTHRRMAVNLSWLIMLRWVAVIGQLLTIGVVILLLSIEIPMPIGLGVVIGLTAASNLMLQFWSREWRHHPTPQAINWDLILGLVLIMDLLSLTSLLFVTGGPHNPFALFFFVNVSLSAVVLRPAWAWALEVLAVACFSWLLISHMEIKELNISPQLRPILQTHEISMLHVGMWLAFATSSSVVVYFLTRLTGELRIQEASLQHRQMIQAGREKLESLGTLAAGTAHELATPLSTIAIVAKEVEQFFEENPLDIPGADDVIDDIRLIRSQLDRCRVILDRMASQSGQAVGETIQNISCAEFWLSVLEEVSEPQRVRLVVNPEIAKATLYVPPIILSQSMRGFVQNAIDADPSGKEVVVEIQRFAKHWLWTVTDQGSGMPESVLQRISEPFFTTKPTGKGMGLGVYLAKNVVERLDGTIDYQSTVGVGTKVTIRLPRTFPSETDET
jgi:two-component system, sensor histidine kinase RegB